MRVLDLGCKDGRAVTELWDAGYDIYGVDVNAEAIELGRKIGQNVGLDSGRLVLWENPSELSPLPDDFFHFVYSNRVFEHVQHQERTASELARITRSGGQGLHIFPGPFRPIEGHLFMPIVHWLPKNRLRRLAIQACVRSGWEPRWPQVEDKSVREKTEVYYSYSCGKTYYRTFGRWQKSFERYGLAANDVSAQHPSIRKALWVRIATANNKWLQSKLISTFRTIECLTYKPI